MGDSIWDKLKHIVEAVAPGMHSNVAPIANALGVPPAPPAPPQAPKPPPAPAATNQAPQFKKKSPYPTLSEKDVSKLPLDQGATVGPESDAHKKLAGLVNGAPQVMSQNGSGTGSAANGFVDAYGQIISSIPHKDPQQLHDAALSQAAVQFDPQINGLARLGQLNTQNSQASQARMTDMYNALSQSITGGIPQIAKNYEAAQGNASRQFGAFRQGIADDYGGRRDSQNQMMDRLGIGAAAPDVFRGQANDQRFFNSLAGSSEGALHSALSQIQANDTAWSRQGAELAKYEGANRTADLVKQLNDFNFMNNGKINDLQTAKEMSIPMLENQLATTAEDRAWKREQQLHNEMMDRGNFALKQDDQAETHNQNQIGNAYKLADLDQDKSKAEAQNKIDMARINMEAAKGNKQATGNAPIDKASEWLAQTYPEDQGNKIMGYIMQAMQDPRVMLNQQPSGDPMHPNTAMTPQAFAAIAVDKAKASGLTAPADLQAVNLAALRAFG